ncbi:MAG: protease modulator HflK [Gemmataceae bacterium]|nr:protease modulator HflK [Gemmataceae bacterium]
MATLTRGELMWRYTLYLLGLIFGVWTVATSLTQVQSHERAVIRRFGRILDTKPEQGLHISWPWGIDRVDLAPVGRVRDIKVGYVEKKDDDDSIVPIGQMVTGDHNLVNVQATIYFRVREADVEKFVLQQANIDAFVARAAESLLAEWIAGRTVDDVLRRGKHQLAGWLVGQMQDRLADYDLGVDIKRVSITDLSPPDQVKDAFSKLTNAQQSIPTKLSNAKREINTKSEAASSKMHDMKVKAEAYARTELVGANAEATSFRTRLDSYRELSRRNVDYLNTLWLDDMTRIYAKMREEGRVELLDHYLTSEGLTITQFPLTPRKK